MAQEQAGAIRGDYAKPVDDAKLLDMSELITTFGSSIFGTASAGFSMFWHKIKVGCADFFIPTPDINVGCASPSNSVAESSSEYFSTRIENMIQKRKEFATDLEFEVEASRVHWSETQLNVAENEINLQALKLEMNGVEEGASQLGEADGVGKTTETNIEIFQSLQKKYGDFFCINKGFFVVGGMIAVGGQAEVFEDAAHRLTVLKVFKGVYALRDLEKQWPLGMLQNERLKINSSHIAGFSCVIHKAVLLEDGQFAFSMRRYWGDLRKLIDDQMRRNLNEGPPFTSGVTLRIMLDIALAMKGLHKSDIVHRDLKAANVLIEDTCQSPDKEMDPMIDLFYCNVADFECSNGVVGTRFWRAPEILLAVKGNNIKPELFTKSADVYSYAMTCYEIITGHIPFEDVARTNYDIVIDGERPKLPSNIKPWMRDLITKCWHPDPLERPNFISIVHILWVQPP